MWQAQNLKQFPNLIHAFSQLPDGNMSFSRPGGDALQNRLNFLSKLGVSYDQLVRLDCIHKTKITKVLGEASETGAQSNADPARSESARQRSRETSTGSSIAERVHAASKIITKTDGAFTFDRGLFLFTTFADCLPIYFFDPTSNCVGLVHAGWRGILANIIFQFTKKIKKEKLNPQNFFVAIGPHIQKCCFEVGSDVKALFKPEYSLYIKGKFIDLTGIATHQLQSAGFVQKNIFIAPECTLSDPKFFSHRRPENSGANAAIIGLL